METPGAQGLEQSREERIRAVVKIVQETGIDEITVEEGGMRVSVRRTPELPAVAAIAPVDASAPGRLDEPPIPPAQEGLWRVESPMVGTFYRAPGENEPPFVEEGDAVAEGQTLCILEAMKLMNPVKAEIEGIVRRIHVAQRRARRVRAAAVRARAVERPPARDLTCSRACWLRTAARSRCG